MSKRGAMADRFTPTIAIVGGGFSGAAVAWQLRRQLTVAADIIIIEPRSDLGRGLAYSTRDPSHRINVPAVRMNINPDDEDDFQNWLTSTDYPAADSQAALPDGRLFPTRHAFGTYIGDRLRALPDPVKHIVAKAANVETIGDRFRITCQNGETIQADVVVLAICHAPPDTPKSLLPQQDHPRFVTNPWNESALRTVQPGDRVLIVGTGLTMADTVASLDRLGHHGDILAISRRGLRSQPHAADGSTYEGSFISPPADNATTLLRQVRDAIDDSVRSGSTWQAVIDRVREQGQDIWRALSIPARHRVLRHLRPYWDTHRFRIAPQVHDVLERRIGHGTLNIEAGSVRAHSTSPATLTVELRRRHETQWQPSTFDAVILATGPSHATVVDHDPLLSLMKTGGLIRPDVFGLGIEVDLEGHAIGGGNATQENLFVAGPLARGTFGELMGIFDLATYAEKITANISRTLNGSFPAAS
jgi:uncharacterized NAD(P)/FAD-binding protein YdhS